MNSYVSGWRLRDNLCSAQPFAFTSKQHGCEPLVPIFLLCRCQNNVVYFFNSIMVSSCADRDIIYQCFLACTKTVDLLRLEDAIRGSCEGSMASSLHDIQESGPTKEGAISAPFHRGNRSVTFLSDSIERYASCIYIRKSGMLCLGIGNGSVRQG